MHYLSYSSSSPAYNLALEEVLLEPMIKKPKLTPIFRSWKNSKKCVVIGRGEKIEKQVQLEHVHQDQIPVLRRISGGGTVLHGPDNINLSFFLPYSHHESLTHLKRSYLLILSWVQKALTQSHQLNIEINGSCDLVINNKKFSGTAQARKRHGLLHHMTILVHADFKGMMRYLKEPEKQPEYRNKRKHEDFVTGLQDECTDFNSDLFIDHLRNILSADQSYSLTACEKELCDSLVEKYQNKEWNYEGRFSKQ